MQSESVELQILLNWSDELTIYPLLLLHRAFHVARMWPNSKYEDINEILYRPSIVPGGGSEHYWGGGEGGAPAPHPPISGVARTQPMPGHSVGTLRLLTQAPPSFKPLAARNAEATIGGSGGCSPRTFWNF